MINLVTENDIIKLIKGMFPEIEEVPATISFAHGEIGELAIRGYVMAGYYKNEEKTNEIMDKDGWLYTGDLAKYYDKENIRACSVSFYVRIFEHDFVGDKEKIHRHTVVWQEFLTQSTAKSAKKTCGKRC